MSERIGEIPESASETDFDGVIPSLLARTILDKAFRLLDGQLLGKEQNHIGWDFRQVFRECSKESRCAQLNPKTQSVAIAPVSGDDFAISVIQVEMLGKLFR